jgi:hypothetical protein
MENDKLIINGHLHFVPHTKLLHYTFFGEKCRTRLLGLCVAYCAFPESLSASA